MEEVAASDEDDGHQEDTNMEDDGYGYEDGSMADLDFINNGQVEEGIDDLDLYYGRED